MALTVRPFLFSGVAVASTAALSLATPVALPGVPSPLQLSTAQYELAALSDVTVEGIAGAFTAGWGGFIGADDVFYPGEFANDVLLTGFGGAAYYVLDRALDGIVPFNLENYAFEVGSRSPGNELVAGLGAAAYVGVGSVFGADSAPAQFVKALIGGGSFDLGTAVVALTSGVPVVGDLTSVYFTGQVAGDDTAYGTGLAGVFAYVGTLLPALSGVDFAGLLSGVAGLIGTIGGLISGGSGNGNGNGNGGGGNNGNGNNGNGNGNGGSHAEGSDDSSQEDEDSDDADLPDSEESDAEESHGSGHGNQVRAAVPTPYAGAAVARAAAATGTAPKAAAVEAVADEAVATDVTEVADTAEDVAVVAAPKHGASRGTAGRAARSAR